MNQAFRLAMGEDRVLRGDLYPAKGTSRGTLLICHGYKGFKDWGMFPYAAEQLSEGLDVLAFNFSYNGIGEEPDTFTELEKFARNTYSRELEDMTFLMRTLEAGALPTERKPLASPLFLLGHSRGGGVCLLYAFDHPEQVAGVISWNGITDVDLFTDREKEQMRTAGRSYVVNARTKQQMPLDKEILDDLERNRERFAILERAGDSRVPAVLIQGEKDHPRLLAGSEELTRRRPDISWLKIPGANHTFNAKHPLREVPRELEQAIELTAQWISSQLEGAGTASL
ncbi:hypothetical protein J31TS4_29960 [Paenibacillus sp. J31TS4]|uniref:alpha/beta hydrolase family protein n=1 Tax=Paenibacillus sp. J31TS4 TaxID=2807195 RepID=UPI001B1F3F8F|nr:alpha/beta fold hydrolase [Paenibacillus sp. J31TS4]GIP39716.1 hypothetical protein J31TS4_29960 [Paenibacillus sp. J31TS4]